MLTLLIVDIDPDIMRTIHLVLLNLQHSELNKKGQLKVILHFRGDKAVELDMMKPIDQEYHEFDEAFKGLESVDADFTAALNMDGAGRVIVMSPEGRRRGLDEVFKEAGRHATVVVGGFTEGDYVSEVYSHADYKVSLGDQLLKIPDVIKQVIENYEKGLEE